MDQLGLVASPPDGIVTTDDGRVNLEFKKTKPAYVLCKLRRNGMREEELEKCITEKDTGDVVQVSVCVSVFMCVCVYVVRVCVCVCVCFYVCLRVCGTRVCVCVCLFLCVSACVWYTRVCVCVCVCVLKYIKWPLFMRHFVMDLCTKKKLKQFVLYSHIIGPKSNLFEV